MSIKTNMKKYQVWEHDSDGYHFNDFDTLREALGSIKYTEFFITKLVHYQIKEINKKIKC